MEEIFNSANIIKVFYTVIIITLLYIFLSRFFIKTKGELGERRVAKLLRKLPEDEYIVLNDLLFRNDQYTTQIDHIVISIYGIFIIETKNYKGWIYGDTLKEKWTQNIWGHKYNFYNPLFQNNKHVNFLIRKFKAIRDCQLNIYPIVVFIGTPQLYINNCDSLIYLHELETYITSFTNVVMTIQDCRYIATILETENIVDKSEREIHNNNVVANKFIYEEKLRQNICPRCGGDLILRYGKYGEFYGCSNFPRCRFTK